MTIRLTREDNIATLTLDAPEKLNALDDGLAKSAVALLQTLHEDTNLAAIILTGANGLFSAGGNLKTLHELATQLAEGSMTEAEATARINRSAQVVELLRSSPVPTIAAIDGACAGAGIGWAGACDLRIASETAFIDSAYLKLGLGSDFGVAFFLTETVGAAIAKDWLLRPRRVPAAELYARGFVTELYENQEQLMQGAMQIAQFFAADRTLGVQAIRGNVANAEAGTSLTEHLALDSQRFITTLSAPSVAERIAQMTTPKTKS